MITAYDIRHYIAQLSDGLVDSNLEEGTFDMFTLKNGAQGGAIYISRAGRDAMVHVEQGFGEEVTRAMYWYRLGRELGDQLQQADV